MKNIRYYGFKLLANHNLVMQLRDFSELLPQEYGEAQYNIQKNRLNKILEFSKEYVPYYSDVIGNSLFDFPVVNKEIIKSNYDAFFAKGVEPHKLSTRQTSGSTGNPFKIFWDKNKVTRNRACFLFHYQENGYFVGDRLFYFRAWNKKNSQSWIKKLVSNVIEQNCTATNQDIIKFKKKLRGKNNVLWGYVSAVIDYAKKIDKEDITNKVKVIYTSSETLSDIDREFLSESFNCPVFSRYSNEEIGIISHQYQMESNIFRVNWPSVWVEILKLDSNEPVEVGETGRVVITDMDNFALPFIRYDTGDLSSPSKLFEDSITFMNNIEGRLIDWIADADGNKLSPFHVNNLAFWKKNNVFTYQFIQTGVDSYIMKVVPKDGFNEKPLIAELREFLGVNSKISVECVKEIPLSKSGKRKYIINQVNNNV